jgi:opacity protein-like surface antigen
MHSRARFAIRTLCALYLLLLSGISVHAQVIRAGLKAGSQLSWIVSDDPAYKRVADIQPRVGFHAGGVLEFKVRERLFLHTELIYSQRGKTITSNKDSSINKNYDRFLKDKVNYHYTELPILFIHYFRGQLGKEKYFKWYVAGGPNIAYWMGGNGTISSSDLRENNIESLKYKIRFGRRVEHSHPEIVYVNSANRIQFGLNIGGGFMLEPAPKQKIMVDIRYEMGHTRMGKPTSTDYLIPSDYEDNLKARTKALRLSVMYLIEYNSSKKERNKGKSTLRRSGRK